MRRLDAADPGFEAAFAALVRGDADRAAAVRAQARAIVDDVGQRGDDALIAYTRELDAWPGATTDALAIPRARQQAALAALPAAGRRALEAAANRLTAFAERQCLADAVYDDSGLRLGHVVRAIERAGVYAPGGKAAYPSSVLMNALPARAAGVDEVTLVSPAAGGQPNDWVMAAAAVAGVDRFFAVGGAQAIAALAYGTATMPAVDKIVGPGNAFVAAAKREVFGQVGIESVAGPSEVLIVADGSGEPEWAALDLFAQAEHDEMARAVLICPDNDYLEAVAGEVAQRIDAQTRSPIIRAALAAHGALIRVADLDAAMALANRIAPEHLELAVAEPEALLAQVRHAGAVFLGHHSAEVFGDYCAGPNHVLPTGRSARFASALGAYDFQKRISILQAAPAAARELAPIAAALADAEGLDAHAASARARETSA